MKIKIIITMLLGIVLNNAPASAQSTDTDLQPSTPTEIQGEEIVRSMGNFLDGLSQFSFVANVNYDRALPSEQLIEVHEIHEVAVRRPGQLRATVLGENGLRAVVINNGTATLVDPISRKYFQCSVPESLGEATDVLVIDLGLSLPNADFIYEDAGTLLLADVKRSEYLGVVLLDGQACHHIAFAQDGLDWQLWVSAGVHPLPQRISLQYVDRPGKPRFSASLEWHLSGVRYGDTAFTFVADDTMQLLNSIDEFLLRKDSE
ncbi:MAG: DUF2092 domain-containing protein [Planctomycetota bacterium]